MANPRKPNQLKVVAGTDRPDRQGPEPIDLPLVSEIPEAPAWLPNEHAVAEWKRLTQILHANDLLTEAGLGPLGMLCALHGKLVQMWSAGMEPTGHMLAQYRSMVNDFGLTPVAQTKVRASGDSSKPGNKFAKNGRRKVS